MTAQSGNDPVHAVLDRGLRQLAGLGGDLVEHANSIGTILWSPPRVVIVGRLKAGKSTLVNALVPGTHRAVGHVNAVTGRGRHTSTSAVALELADGGWVIDTPGVRSFGLGHVDPDNILRAYPDVDPDRVEVVHNGIDTQLWRPAQDPDALRALGIDPDAPSVVFVGRITRQKGLPHLLRAARGVTDQLADSADDASCSSSPFPASCSARPPWPPPTAP